MTLMQNENLFIRILNAFKILVLTSFARRHVLISITLALGILNLQSLSFWWTPFNHLSLSPIKKSRELIKKLEKLASKHEGGALQRQVTVHKRVKSMNESIYYSVDAIHEAIKNKKKVDFKYYSYDVDKNFKPRRNGATYSVVPFALSWADENYYLIGYYDRYDDVSNFRVDRMDQVCVSKEDIEVLPAYENFDVIDYTNKMFGMFGGNLERVKIKFSHEMVNLVIDKFGKDITIYDKDNCHFCVSLDLAITNTFFSWRVIFGDKAEIMSPEFVREDYKAYLMEICSKY